MHVISMYKRTGVPSGQYSRCDCWFPNSPMSEWGPETKITLPYHSYITLHCISLLDWKLYKTVNRSLFVCRYASRSRPHYADRSVLSIDTMSRTLPRVLYPYPLRVFCSLWIYKKCRDLHSGGRRTQTLKCGTWELRVTTTQRRWQKFRWWLSLSKT